MEENPLTFAEKSDKVLLFQMINCSYTSYGRYFKDTRLFTLNKIIEKEKDDIVSNLILKDYPLSP
jgi:hypothetical protein